MNEKLKKDLKKICDLVDKVAQKHGGIYITADHCEGELKLLASCTTKINGRFESVSKYADEYSLC